MLCNKNFRFNITISKEAYKTKDESSKCLSRKLAATINRNKMAFKRQFVTVDEFLNAAKMGFNFCGLFNYDPSRKYRFLSMGRWISVLPEYNRGPNKGYMKLTFKRDKFFEGSQAIFIDIDQTRFNTIPEYINNLTYKPTCAYPSFSDGLCKHGVTSRRFHLVYVFDQILGPLDFASISLGLTRQIEADLDEAVADACGTRKSQYFNGCYGATDIYATYQIYNKDECPKKFSGSRPKVMPTLSDLIVDPVFADGLDKAIKWTAKFKDLQAIYAFKYRYSSDYDYIYRTERDDWVDGTYQKVNSDFVRLYWNQDTVPDGDHRRKKVFQRMCLRRLMEPKISIEKLIYNAVLDVLWFFDYSDGVFTYDFFCKNARNALLMSIPEIKSKFQREINFSQPKSGVIFKKSTDRGVQQKVYKNLRWEKLDSAYDRTKSVKENLENLQKAGFEHISLSTLYRYCRDRGINTKVYKNTYKDIYDYIDPEKSEYNNICTLRSMNFKITKSRFDNIYDERLLDYSRTTQVII